MARFRLSRRAQADLADILAQSEERWGSEAKSRYEAVVAAAISKIAADPISVTTRDRGELSKGLRSFHIRHARGHSGTDAKVRHPVHVLFYRVVAPDIIEIVRVLHERMEPSRHIGPKTADWAR